MSTPLHAGRPGALTTPEEHDQDGPTTSRISVTTAGLGVVGGTVGLLAGAWLMYAPFALGYQSDYSVWSDATTTDFWDGFSVAVVGLIGLVAAIVGFVGALRATGAIAPRAAARPEPEAVPAAAPAPAPADDLTALLRPLVEALNRDNADATSGASNGNHESTTVSHRASLDPTFPQER